MPEAGASRAPPTPSPQAWQRDASGGPGTAPPPPLLAGKGPLAPPPLPWVGVLRKGAAAAFAAFADGGAAWPQEIQITSRAEIGGVLASLLARPPGAVTLRRLWPASEAAAEARRAAARAGPLLFPALELSMRSCCRRRCSTHQPPPSPFVAARTTVV
jgi:hypothetical protein